MEDRQRYFECRPVFLGMQFRGNPPAVIFHRDRVVGMDGHFNILAVTCQRLINRVVHHFVNQVMQSPVVHVADIHGRTLPYRLETFKHLDTVSSVILIRISVPVQLTVHFIITHNFLLICLFCFPMVR